MRGVRISLLTANSYQLRSWALLRENYSIGRNPLHKPRWLWKKELQQEEGLSLDPLARQWEEMKVRRMFMDLAGPLRKRSRQALWKRRQKQHVEDGTVSCTHQTLSTKRKW